MRDEYCVRAVVDQILSALFDFAPNFSLKVSFAVPPSSIGGGHKAQVQTLASSQVRHGVATDSAALVWDGLTVMLSFFPSVFLVSIRSSYSVWP